MPEALSLKIGDKVKLVGLAWEDYNGLKQGEVVEVTELKSGGWAWNEVAGSLSDPNGLPYGSDTFAVEKVEPEPEPAKALAIIIEEHLNDALDAAAAQGFDEHTGATIIRVVLKEMLG